MSTEVTRAPEDESYCEYSIGIPARFFDDERVYAIMEDALSQIEALSPEGEWYGVMVATKRPGEPDRGNAAAASPGAHTPIMCSHGDGVVRPMRHVNGAWTCDHP